MDMLFDEIDATISHGLYQMALMGALALPDICSAMQSANGIALPDRYRTWFESNYVPRVPDFSGADCYRLRCTMLHQGTTQHPASSYERIVFNKPGRASLHNCVVNNTAAGGTIIFHLDLAKFCTEMTASARTWHRTAQHTPNYRHNFNRFLALYPDGIGGVYGMPFLA